MVRRSFRAGLLTLALSFSLLLSTSCGFFGAGATPPPAGALAVSFIDVGQGDATLVQSGGQSYLVDGGRPEAGPEVVDFLRSRGVEELDGLVATHPDADHIGGLPDVFDAFPVSAVYLSGESGKGTTTANTFLRAVRDEGARVFVARAGMSMDWGGTGVDVLSPPPEAQGGLFGEPNEDSVALLLSFGAARVLLTGDAENRGEEYMSTGRHTGPVTVLKVGHHGSNSSTTPLFLNRFRSEIAVISVGENSYGHPTPQTLRRLETVGAEVFRTDEHGDVLVTIKDEQVEVAITEY
ncbi:MAG: ComEC/Rec2 family competence protein [Rubrobacteraceae bacterium]